MAANPRKQLIVERSSQGAMILRTIVYWVFSVITIGLMMLLWDLRRGPVGPFFDPALYDTLREKYVIFSIAALLVLPVLVVDVWKQSNRYAGPVFRVRRCLRELAAGKSVERVTFRKNDYWRGLADDLNGAIDYVARLKAKAPDANHRPEAPADAAGELVGTAGENGRGAS